MFCWLKGSLLWFCFRAGLVICFWFGTLGFGILVFVDFAGLCVDCLRVIEFRLGLRIDVFAVFECRLVGYCLLVSFGLVCLRCWGFGYLHLCVF